MTGTSSTPIPFYGATIPRLFEIERRCMDRDGVVIAFLDEALPGGRVLDIGAGNGYVGSRIARTQHRSVVAMEPDPRMVDPSRSLLWSAGIAQAIPFHDGTFDAAYATWAYFVAGVPDRICGFREVTRVVRDGGPIVIIDNAGGDEFCALSRRVIAEDGQWYAHHGFSRTVLETSFRFDSLEEARELLSFYFGEDAGRSVCTNEIGFSVAAYVGESGVVGQGPARVSAPSPHGTSLPRG
jgi:SAM-dependent methyltransferase